MKEIIFIEENGPIIISGTICYIIGFTPYLVAYLLGIIFSIQLNRILKSLLKYPRPIIPFEYENDGIEEYGMPSGHAQIIGFSIGFIHDMKISPYLLIILNFIGILTIYLRYESKKHTIWQLCVGYFLGCISGIIIYYGTKRYLVSR